MSESRSVKAFAATISKQRIGLAIHRPESFATAYGCFNNVRLKIERSGGRAQTGWMFVVRSVEAINNARYWIAVHHVVWHAPNGELIDVTPLHVDRKHHPFMPRAGHVAFLLDDSAGPATINGILGPQPNRYAPLDESAAMTEHVSKLTEAEPKAWRQAFDAARRT